MNRSSARPQRAVLLSVVGLGLGLFAACGGGTPVTAAEPVSGREVFEQQCAVCHGQQGEGGVGLRLAGGSVVAKFPRIEDQLTFVRSGKGTMPAFGGSLTAEQLRAVVEYTRTL
jgi:mono/diheme cytochrome c family protein